MFDHIHISKEIDVEKCSTQVLNRHAIQLSISLFHIVQTRNWPGPPIQVCTNAAQVNYTLNTRGLNGFCIFFTGTGNKFPDI
ncbi:hypothetical protein D3C87_1991210 [compost metagenome]